jgi:hypothetical protein
MAYKAVNVIKDIMVKIVINNSIASVTKSVDHMEFVSVVV